MRADRLLSMVLILQTRGRVTAQEMAAKLEVSERTVYRDIDALSIAGIPIYTQPGNSGGIFLDENYRISLTGLSRDQVLSLFASKEAGPLADLGLASAARDSLLKLYHTLPTPHQQEVEQLRQRLHIDPAGWFNAGNNAAHLHHLQAAVWQDRQVEIDYQAVGYPQKTTIVDAYALVSKADRWYLVGRKANGDYRTYRLSRITRAAVLGQGFDRDTVFDLATYWQQSRQQFQQQMEAHFPPYPVTLRVQSDMFWYLGSFLEGRFEIMGEADSAGWMPIRIVFGGAHEAQLHTIGMGTKVVVIEPLELRQAVCDVAQAIADHYSC